MPTAQFSRTFTLTRPEAAGVCRHMIEYPVMNSHYHSADGGDSVRVSSQG